MSGTPSQTIGPYWHLLENPAWSDLTRFGAAGMPVVLRGTIMDGAGAPVTDACVELWQAEPAASDTWDGFGRAATDAAGGYRFVTLPAPSITLTIFARGLLRQLTTRAFLAAAAAAYPDLDPVRANTLVARPDGVDGNHPAWRFDIRLQGPDETVFFDV